MYKIKLNINYIDWQTKDIVLDSFIEIVIFITDYSDYIHYVQRNNDLSWLARKI